MSIDDTAPPDIDAEGGESTPASETPKPSAQGFGDVAKRIRSRTTDLLAIAIVVMGAITVGSRIRGWWTKDETGLQSVAETAGSEIGDSSAWGTGGVPVAIDFGESPYSVGRRTFTGNRTAVRKKLVDVCLSILKKTEFPVSLSPKVEQRLLKQIARFQPVAEEAGEWQVYGFDGPVLMATGTKHFVKLKESGVADFSVPADAAKSPQRVVCWGLAFPAGVNSWTLYTFQAANGKRETKSKIPQPALPPGTHRLFALRDENGRTWITFRGHAPLHEWERFYEDWFQKRDWRKEGAWTSNGLRSEAKTSAAVFHLRTKSVSARADVQFYGTETGGFTGTIVVMPLERNPLDRK